MENFNREKESKLKANHLSLFYADLGKPQLATTASLSYFMSFDSDYESVHFCFGVV